MSESQPPAAIRETGHLWFRCGACGYVGHNRELPWDPAHACGKDECPECGVGGCITCCFRSEEAAEKGERLHV